MVWKTCFEPSQTFALQVSELSERQSVGSFEISSSSEDDLEEDDEQDQEYTIYSVLPNRQLEVVSKLPAKSKTSSYRPPGPRGLEDANVRSKGPPGMIQSQTGAEVSIKSAPQSCTVHEGKILTLTCIVAGPKYTGIEGNIFAFLSKSFPDVCWFHGSTRLSPSARHWLYKRGSSHHLAIFDVDSSSSGEYSVCAFDNKEEAWSRFSVTVRGTRRAEHPPEMVRHLQIGFARLC